MKLKELRDMDAETTLAAHMITTQLLRHADETSQEALQRKLILADLTLLHHEIEDHIGALECILEVCEAVSKGRYLEDRQRCHWDEHRCEHACTSREQCENFDDRDPHQAILSWFEDDVVPFSPMLRDWIIAQADLQRKRRGALWGKGGLFGDAKLVMYAQDEDGVLCPMSEEDSKAAMAQHNAKEDTANESMALRVDQYEVNLDHIKRICRAKGDLQEVAAIINDGLPPMLRQAISPS